MTHTIAVAGKGGVGKTTVCGMLIDYLIKTGKGPLLVVDADANSNLNEVLGVESVTSLGEIREEIAQAENCGAQAITLGRRILRTETAGMAVLAMLGYVLEE